MQIWYVVSGACTHIVEGAEYPLHAKNVFVIPPFVEHGLKDERDNFTIICCEFPAELITGDNLFDPAGAACCAIPALRASRRFSAARAPAIRRGSCAG